MVSIVLLSLVGMGLLAALISPLFDDPDAGSDDPAVDPVDQPPGVSGLTMADLVVQGAAGA